MKLTAEVDVEIAQNILLSPQKYLEILHDGLIQAQKTIYENEKDTRMNLKSKLFARLYNLPHSQLITIPTIGLKNRFIRYDGTIIKASVARMLESSQEYKCKKCGTEFNVELDCGQQSLFMKPTKCPNKDGCNSDKFQYIASEENFKMQIKDYQEIKIQEKLDNLSSGSMPKSCLVVLQDDLVDSCKPGDNVTVTGIIVDRWSPLRNDMRPEIDLIIEANNVIVHNVSDNSINITPSKELFFRNFWSDHKYSPFTARNVILSSLCPQLYGMYIVKLSVALMLAGGVSRQDSSGTRVRGESHLLLVGDPGTGKSQFLKYAKKIIPRSVLTTGIGSTSAGLTACASRDGGLWHLEAGALVLADGGICCVDEFNCMKEHDRSSMLEAMEQQSISVAKAGIVCKLKTQCSVLAACNPKGTYDSDQPLTVNIAISSPLLSRFDLVLLLMDSSNEEWDRLASTFLLKGKDLLAKEKVSESWSFEDLRLYINYIRNLTPSLTHEANVVIQKYYSIQRQSTERNSARTTVRMLESVIRLSQAHAKLMFREEVLVMDAVVAITLMECSLNKTASFGNVNILHTSFPENAEIEYKNQVDLILTKLGLMTSLKQEFDYIEANMDPFRIDHQVEENYNNFDLFTQMVGGDLPIRKKSNILKPIDENATKKHNLEAINEDEDEEENQKSQMNEIKNNKTTSIEDSSNLNKFAFKAPLKYSENKPTQAIKSLTSTQSSSQKISTQSSSQKISLQNSSQKSASQKKKIANLTNFDTNDLNFDF